MYTTILLRSKSLFRKLLSYRFNILFFGLCMSLFYYNCWLFLDTVQQPVCTDIPSSVLLHIVTSLLLALPYFCVKRHKWILLIVLVFLNVYFVCNLLYYRTYFTLLPFDSFALVSNLNGLQDSILASFRSTDCFFSLPTLLLTLFYTFGFRKNMVVESLKIRFVSGSIVLLFCISVIAVNLYAERNNVSNLLSEENEFRYDLVEGASTYGFFHCWVYQAKSLLQPQQSLTAQEKRLVDHWMKEHNATKQPECILPATGKNVILLIVESLESFPIGNKMNGVEITPNINRLLNAEKVLYAPHVVPQVNGGHSSDAQLLFNAGMLPPRTGAACFRYARNTYYTLAKALKAKGYRACTMLGGNASFWNQGVLTRQLGYDELIAIDRYTDDESFEMGLTDSTFLAQSAVKLKALRQPFLAQLITLSSHDPYTLPDGRVCLKVPSGCPEDMAAYLNAIHYVDACIGRFVDALRQGGLLDRSVVVITGDHDATKHQPAQWRVYANRWHAQTSLTPFIVINGNREGIDNRIMGQIDIYPTLLHLLGLQNYAWQGLGKSIFDTSKADYAVNAHHAGFGDVRTIPEAVQQHIRSAWDISDLMVTRDYFGKQ